MWSSPENSTAADGDTNNTTRGHGTSTIDATTWPSAASNRSRRTVTPNSRYSDYHVHSLKKEGMRQFWKGCNESAGGNFSLRTTAITAPIIVKEKRRNTNKRRRTSEPSTRSKIQVQQPRPSSQSSPLAEEEPLAGLVDSVRRPRESNILQHTTPQRRSTTTQRNEQAAVLPEYHHDGLDIHTRLDSQNGRAFNSAMRILANDELRKKNFRNGNARRRRIDIRYLGGVVMTLLGVVYLKRRIQNRMNALIDCVFDYLAVEFPDRFEARITKKARAHIRQFVMKPHLFCKAMDMHASLNKECLNVMRSDVEGLPSNTVGCIPHGSTVSRAARQLERYAEDAHQMHITEEKTACGVVFKFDFDITIRLLISAFGLEEHAKTGSKSNPVLMTVSYDHALFTQYLGHVTLGIKMLDARAVDPLSGLPLCMVDQDGTVDVGKLQSRELCFPLFCLFGKDTKKAFDSDLGRILAKFCNKLVIPSLLGLPELSNFKLVANQDMAAVWRAVGKGGGSSNATLSCYGCMAEKNNLANYVTDSAMCQDCVSVGVDKCYCQEFVDQTVVENCRENIGTFAMEMTTLQKSRVELAVDDAYKYLDKIKNESKILTGSQQVDRLGNRLHIDFEPVDESDEVYFNSLLSDELKLRLRYDKATLISLLKSSVETRRDYLKKLVLKEEGIELARQTVGREDQIKKLTDKLVAEQCVPCILHLEMRVAHKLFWSLLGDGLDRYRDGDSCKRKKYIAAVTDCMEHCVLGNIEHDRVHHWKLPVTAKGKLAPRSMTNDHARKCMEGMNQLAGIVYSEELDESSTNPQQIRKGNARLKSQWQQLVKRYFAMMRQMRQHSDFSDAQILTFHKKTAQFMDSYCSIYDNDSSKITNYIHIIGAGHLTYYLRKYRNLYKFSQQGWEALNQKTKHYYFNNTNHGGNQGNKNGGMVCGNHLLPIMKMWQRWYMWRLGLGDAFFMPLPEITADNPVENVDAAVEEDLELLAMEEGLEVARPGHGLH